MPNHSDYDNSYSESDWKRVGRAVRERMAQLRFTQTDLVKRADVSDMTIRPIQNGEMGNYRESTLSSVSIALEWPYNAIRRILDGEDPDTFLGLPGPTGPQTMPPAPKTDMTLGERLDALPADARKKVEQMIESILDLAESDVSRGNGNRGRNDGPMAMS